MVVKENPDRTEEIHRETSKLLNKKGRIAVGPDGSNIYYCHNKKNIRIPVPVEYDTRVNGQIVTCLSKSCIRYKSFNVCCHTVAITNKLNVLNPLISKLNAKSTTEQGANKFCKCQPRHFFFPTRIFSPGGWVRFLYFARRNF